MNFYSILNFSRKIQIQFLYKFINEYINVCIINNIIKHAFMVLNKN